MGHEESLIVIRIYEVVNLILSFFTSLSAYFLYNLLDTEEVISNNRLILNISLPGGFKFSLVEEYRFEDYQLKINHYNYVLLYPDGRFALSYDNSPHHPSLDGFPHHKHRYPRDKYPALSFSGSLKEALDEIRWFIEKVS